ncbi:MAG: FRG domain-containing protein, partial [Flavisolibacter sp.]
LIPSALREDRIREFYKYYQIVPDQHLSSETLQQQTEIHLLCEFYRLCNQQGLSLPVIPKYEAWVKHPETYSIVYLRPFKHWIPEEFYEIACLAQHYGVPTRLLDWSYDFITALFFAISDKDPSDEQNIVLWCLKLENEFGRHWPLKFLIPQYFDNPNSKAQSGILTLWETDLQNFGSKMATDRRPLDKIITDFYYDNFANPETHLYKIIIPHSQIKELTKTLNILSYNESKIFPGYHGVVSMMRNKLND